MKRIFIITTILLSSVSVIAASTPKDVKYRYTDATDLTLVGKLFEDTSNPYHRIDTERFTGFNERETIRLHEPSGLAVAFRTNSTSITVKAKYLNTRDINNSCEIAEYGFDLYIKENGRWVYADSHANTRKNKELPHVLIKHMEDTEKECLVYLPLYSELESVKIGVVEGSDITAIEQPFRHRICVFGSSFTQGSGASRPGMIWSSQLARHTGLGMLNIGLGGHCTLQMPFAEAFAEADIDAIIIDGFSNPKPSAIKKRLFPFIKKLQAAHPDIPIVFLKTIYRETRNFNKSSDQSEAEKMEVADSLMKIACTEYDNVYYLTPDATCEYHDTSTDGTHPSDFGYRLWADSIRKPLLKIFKKYGIQ